MPRFIVVPKDPDEQRVGAAGDLSREEAITFLSEGFASGLLDRLSHFGKLQAHSADEPVEYAAGAEEIDADVIDATLLPAVNILLLSGRDDLGAFLKKDPEVELFADVEGAYFVIENDESGEGVQPELWHQHHLQVEKAKKAGLSGKGVYIGFVDTGIDGSHGEFANKTELLFQEFDPNGHPINSKAYESYLNGGHGTGVAALAAGRNVGIAPNAPIAMALALPNFRGRPDQVIAALNWLSTAKRNDGRQGMDLINCSMTQITGLNRPIHNQIYKGTIARIQQTLGIEVLAAIGNGGPGTHGSPADYADVIGVGAEDQNHNLYQRCSHGTVPQENVYKPDFLAPGVNVYTAGPNNAYLYKTATSYATAAASGLAALLKEQAGQSGKQLQLRSELESRGTKVAIGNKPHDGHAWRLNF